MTENDLLEQAEETLRLQEEAGLHYPTPAERADAKLRIHGALTKRAKQAQIPDAAAASEGGTVISAEGDETLESLNEQRAKLREGGLTAEKVQKIKELRLKADKLIGDVTVKIDAG